jgi:hypothetical protein
LAVVVEVDINNVGSDCAILKQASVSFERDGRASGPQARCGARQLQSGGDDARNARRPVAPARLQVRLQILRGIEITRRSPARRTSSINEVVDGLQAISAEQAKVYKDFHAHPELSFQETKTAALAAKLKEIGYEVFEGIEQTAVVSVLRNGDGQTGLARAAGTIETAG